MADLINIQGLFSNILNTPEQMAQEQLNRNVGLFNQGMAGTLGEARTNFQNNLRGSVQQLGSAINPNFDVRTPDQQFRSAVNAIDPEDEQAREKYIAATKQFAPSKLPSLMENLKRQDLEEEQLNFQREERAQKRVQWGNDAEAFEIDKNRSAQLAEVSSLEIAALNQDVGAQAAAREFLASSQKAQTDPNYATQIASMSPAGLQAEVKRVGAEEGARNEQLGETLKEEFKGDTKMLALIDDMPFGARQSIVEQLVNDSLDKGNFSVVSTPTGTYTHNSKTNEFTLIESAAPAKVKPASDITAALSVSLLEGLRDINNGRVLEALRDVVADGARVDSSSIQFYATSVQKDLQDQGLAGDVNEIRDEIVRRVEADELTTRESTDALADSILQRNIRNAQRFSAPVPVDTRFPDLKTGR